MDLYRESAQLGLVGCTIDPAYGGSGMDAAAYCAIHEELSAADPAFCLSYLASSCLFGNNLSQNGSEEQKMKYLPDFCEGKTIGGMCMSEPAVGTDVLGMQTSAVRDGDNYILNGQKMWITNGAINDTETGDVFLVYARVGDNAKELSMFIVEKDFPGFSLGQRIKDKSGMRASGTAELVFEDCVVPAENRVGPEGAAMVCMMRNLEIERVVLAAMSCGIARKSIEVMNQYGQDRKAFGKPLHSFGQIQRYISDSYAQYMAGKTYLYHTAGQMELDSSGQRLDTDGVKLFCTTMGKDVADNAIQVLGGYGYCGEYHVERLWRDAKLLEIGGGTLESHQKNMVRELLAHDKLP